jgi:UPF0755 protein
MGRNTVIRMSRGYREWISLHKGKLITIALLVAVFALFLVLFLHYFYPERGTEPVRVMIEEGDSTSLIADKLYHNGVITSASIFRFMAWLQGRQGRLKAGHYVLTTGMHYGEVFSLLEAGPNYEDRLVIPEGLTVSATAERVAESTGVSEKEFLEAASSGDYGVEMIPAANRDNLEGFLFPKTYDVPADFTAREIVEVLLNQFEKEVASLDWTRAEKLGVTPYQVITIASMIEKEAVLDEERPLVAAVIYNRLRKNMLLQIDATVQYALPQWKEKLTYEDLKVPSPYNTYLNKGVPPAPICSPGLASIEAALSPAEVDYLYYVASGGGRHFFTSNYEEFLRVKKEVQGS